MQLSWRKRKVYSLSRKERGKVYKFIKEQLRKEYIRPLKSSQIVLMSYTRFTYLDDTSLQWYYPSTSITQVHLLWWPSFLQHVSAIVIQSRYLVFHDRDTPIQLSLPWQSSYLTPISVLPLEPQVSPISSIYI